MQAVIFIGIQGSGKSSFFKERFADTHIRLNLDMLRTRRRERILFQACIEAVQPLVIDNTNPTREDRTRYLQPLRDAGFQVDGYYFSSSLKTSLLRNEQREGRQRIPDAGIRATASKLQRPCIAEGFSHLYYVRLEPTGFVVETFHED